MHKRFLSFIIAGQLLVSLFGAMPVWADTLPSSVIISQLQTGGNAVGMAGQEFVELYNTSQNDVNISGWCLTYASSNDTSQSTVGCFTPADNHTQLWLPTHGFALAASPDFIAANIGLKPDVTFAYVGGIAAGGGHVRLIDSAQDEVDKLGWGTAINPEGIAAPVSGGGKSLQRLQTQAIAQDTNDNSLDFMVLSPPLLHPSGLYEQTITVDVCSNIDDVQAIVPDGYEASDDGLCTPLPLDVCSNIDGTQADIPDDYEFTTSGLCVPIPLESSVLDITELLANPSGSDRGNEFIEVYNPNIKEVRLHGYVLFVGPNFEKDYPLPDQVLPAKEYKPFYDDALGFTLVNSSSRVRLVAPAGNIVSESTAYNNPTDDLAWAMIDGSWQYTTQMTPGAPNIPTPPEDPPLVVPVQRGCPTGKYRNPLTNRCRTIETDAALLASCNEGEYRSPDTNRCRKIVAVTSESSLAPCSPGEVRNPDTNRCRKIATTSAGITAAAIPVQKQAPWATVSEWLVLGALGSLAVGYGVFEWRHEIAKLARMVFQRHR